MLAQALFLLAEHLHGLAYEVSFPEAVVPTVAALKRLAKTTKITSLQQRARRLVAQCEAQSAWLLRKREAVDFSPKVAIHIMYFYPSIYLSNPLSICPSVKSSIPLSFPRSLHLPLYLSTPLSTPLSIYPSIPMYIPLCI